jgi:cytochrome P450
LRSFCFGSDNALLEDLKEVNRQRESLAQLLRSINMNKHFNPVFKAMSMILPLFKGVQAIPAGIRDMIAFRAKARKDIDAILADRFNDHKGQHSIFHELRDTQILPDHEKTAARLQDEATLLVMAGTESTTKTLGIAAFYLLDRRHVMQRLWEELKDAKANSAENYLPLNTLLALPHLGTVMNEANRLSFGLTRRVVRY